MAAKKASAGRVILLSATALLILQCWWPEKFDATLEVNADKSYTFRYDGVLTFAPAVAEIRKSGRLDAGDEDDLRKAAAELAREPGFKSVSYLGEGRYRVLYEKSGVVDRRVDLFGDSLRIVSLNPTSEGIIIISGMSIDGNVRRELAEIGLGLDGTVRVLSGLRVLEQNAQKTPILGGLVGSYEWHLTMDRQITPNIVVSNEPAAKPIMAASTAGGLGVGAVVLLLLAATLFKRQRDSATN